MHLRPNLVLREASVSDMVKPVIESPKIPEIPVNFEPTPFSRSFLLVRNAVFGESSCCNFAHVWLVLSISCSAHAPARTHADGARHMRARPEKRMRVLKKLGGCSAAGREKRILHQRQRGQRMQISSVSRRFIKIAHENNLREALSQCIA